MDFVFRLYAEMKYTPLGVSDLLPFLSGVTCKVYDDFIADGVVRNERFTLFLQLFQMMSLTLLSHNDFVFALFFYLGNILNALSNPAGYAPPYEFSFVLLFPLLIVYSFRSYTSMSRYDVIWIIQFFILMFLEPFFFSQETSQQKFMFRFATSFSCIMQVLLMKHLLSPSLLKGILFGLGYCLVSSLVQMTKTYSSAHEHASNPTPA